MSRIHGKSQRHQLPPSPRFPGALIPPSFAFIVIPTWPRPPGQTLYKAPADPRNSLAFDVLSGGGMGSGLGKSDLARLE
ncbi:unnamed protein product [Caenorhabditis nigoni]